MQRVVNRRGRGALYIAISTLGNIKPNIINSNPVGDQAESKESKKYEALELSKASRLTSALSFQRSRGTPPEWGQGQIAESGERGF